MKYFFLYNDDNSYSDDNSRHYKPVNSKPDAMLGGRVRYSVYLTGIQGVGEVFECIKEDKQK